MFRKFFPSISFLEDRISMVERRGMDIDSPLFNKKNGLQSNLHVAVNNKKDNLKRLTRNKCEMRTK